MLYAFSSNLSNTHQLPDSAGIQSVNSVINVSIVSTLSNTADQTLIRHGRTPHLPHFRFPINKQFQILAIHQQQIIAPARLQRDFPNSETLSSRKIQFIKILNKPPDMTMYEKRIMPPPAFQQAQPLERYCQRLPETLPETGFAEGVNGRYRGGSVACGMVK
jgi:hypothetical protein